MKKKLNIINLIIILSLPMIVVAQSNVESNQCTERTEEQWKSYFTEHIGELDPIEGLWNCKYRMTQKFDDGSPDYIIDGQSNNIIVRIDDYFYQCSVSEKTGATLSNTTYGKDGSQSFSKHTYQKTAVKGVYLYNSFLKMTGGKFDSNPIENNANAILTDGIMKYTTTTDPGSNELIEYDILLKLYPKIEDLKILQTSSGTGFALSSNGMIVTNNHVVQGAEKIAVKGVNGDFSKAYKAKVITTDKNNDLAIIQIDDPSFQKLGNIPFTISRKTSEVGSSIFVLGYPLRASMGDEIKLTNGIISSKSGYQGDITTYQISAPVQPGNSGGPVFDSKGNLIGILNAKLTGAENASYCIKAFYLLNLVESLNNAPILPSINTIGNKSLPEQVKTVKKYTYIIEVN